MHKTLSVSNILAFPNFWPKASPAARSIVRARRASPVATNQQRLWLGYALVGLNVAFIVISILEVNFYAGSGYIIKDMQNKIASLTEENKKLNMRTAQAGSVLQIQQDLSSVGYVPSGGAVYVQAQQFSQR